MKSLGQIIKALYYKRIYTNRSRNVNVWIFGEWFGNRCYDNCFTFANYIAEKNDNLTIYWVAKSSNTETSKLNKKIHLLEYGSSKNLELFKLAGVVCVNQGFEDISPEGINYFHGGVSVNLWHGVPWKRIGHDASKSSNPFLLLYQKICDITFNTSHILSESIAFDKICNSAFGVSEQNVFHIGAPRNSIFYNPNEIKKSKLNLLKKIKCIYNVEYGLDARVITYMPTFRDSKSTVFSFLDFQYINDFEKWLEKNNIIVIQKAHIVSAQRKDQKQYNSKRLFTLNDISPMNLLASTDLLITDYSSCFFDFLALDKPIIHFMYDYDYYSKKDRGLYYSYEKVICGDIAWDEKELLECIQINMENPEKNMILRYKRYLEFKTYDSSNTCDKLYTAISNF